MGYGDKKNLLKQWLDTFNNAIRGKFFESFRDIVPTHLDHKLVLKDMLKTARRGERDLMEHGRRVPSFLADRDYEVIPIEDRADFEWEPKQRSYSPEDYRPSHNFDECYLDVIDQIARPGEPVTVRLSYGQRVRVWIENHYYDKQIGVIISTRSNGDLLLEIQTKHARKDKGSDKKTPKGLMWVTRSDIKILKK